MAGTSPKRSPLAPPGGFPDLPRVPGVRLAAVEAGVRYTGRPDVMLAEIAPGASIAGVFTRSATRSAPVLWCQEILAAQTGTTDGPTGILVNAGNANAFTGSHGMAAVHKTAAAAGAALGIPAQHVLVASTGVIGEALPAERITAKLGDLAAGLAPDAWAPAARAIMTTDTFPKGAAQVVEIGGVNVTLAGIAKGSGMIAPDMATMLAFIFTDAPVAPDLLRRMTAAAAGRSFNCITVDGDTSTSDTLIVAATGTAPLPQIGSARSAAGRAFAAALEAVMRDLALQIVRDGEGATKLVDITVTGAASAPAARRIALAIANSPLVKTALAGSDPNWGRIVMAVGKAGEAADRDKLSIRFGGLPVAEAGWVAPGYDEPAAAAYMKNDEISIAVDVGVGRGRATVWTCDLTHGYVEINADYRS
ncbi:MAG: bifunctional glutamate N-acetyltransferase/amino-acid acetyltransferase ArgJ [Pseudomonadota bacterium]